MCQLNFNFKANISTHGVGAVRQDIFIFVTDEVLRVCVARERERETERKRENRLSSLSENTKMIYHLLN